jgi:hypothetical protein
MISVPFTKTLNPVGLILEVFVKVKLRLAATEATAGTLVTPAVAAPVVPVTEGAVVAETTMEVMFHVVVTFVLAVIVTVLPLAVTL